jgi:hypothetical protein
MLDFHPDSFSDQNATLERLRQEVVRLSMNLGTLANRPETPFAKACAHADNSVELSTHFSYEPVDPSM